MANIQTLHLVERNCFITLQPQSKKPLARDWLNKGSPFIDANKSDFNVGLILGEAS